MRSGTETSGDEDEAGGHKSTADLAVVVSQLLDRVRLLEDRAEIGALIAAYGPLVDAGNGKEAAELWTPDGRYEVAGFEPWIGREAIARVVDEPQHLAYLAAGCAHTMGTPHITVSAHEAVAVNYTTVYVRDEATPGWRADRVSAHRWQLVRTREGWRVKSRHGQVLDGSAQAHEFLAQFTKP